MPGKFFVVDTTLCTACRGCQVACQEWNKLPATKTKQRGSYQNPPDLNPVTYRVVRFKEYQAPTNYMAWYFFSDACRHCLEPPCKEAADEIAKGAIIINPDGAVIYTSKTKQLGKKFKEVRDACPYDIPRQHPATGLASKCHMCYMRVKDGLLPACVKACPTGALNFGDEATMKKVASEHLAAAKKKFGAKARLLSEDIRAWYLLVDDPKKYHEYA